MVIKTMSPSLLFLLCLFLSFGLLSQGYRLPSFGTEHERCIDHCHDTEEEFSGLLSCLSDCQRKYGEEEWGGQGRDPKSPQEEFEQCQEQCQSEERGQQQLCQQRCEKQMREREQEQEREHQEGGREEDPQQQYRQCQERCQREEQGQQQQERCQSRCKEQLREQEEQEQEREERDPKQQFQQCQRKCEEEQTRQGERQCEKRCDKQYKEQQRERGRERNAQKESKRSEEEQQRNNPYYFHAQRFQSRFKTQEGHVRVLQRFTEKSQLLRGIENYRLSIFEANPKTFVVPHHRDADSVFFVLRGKGTITFVLQENRESFNLERGDVIRVQAGTTVYLINDDDNERLHMANLIQPVNTPGQFKDYFAVGNENPESYYRVFSNEVLKTALNTPRDQLDRLFGHQRQGFIIRATQEQLQALSQHGRQTGRSDRGPFNLLNERPTYSNRFGQFFEASPNDFKQLQDLDVSVSFADIKQGAIMMPHYNSRTTTLFLVFEGSGRFEMACPHLSSQGQESQGRRGQEEEDESSGQYQRISAHLSAGDVIVVPAGHPVVIVASQNENLRAVGFGINAQNNKRNFLAGRDNIMNQMEREAKELSFNVPAELVEQIFNNQKESHFAAAGTQQGQQREEGRGHSLASILDFVEIF